MQNMRKHKRFKLNLLDLSSKMSLVGKVELIDISLGVIRTVDIRRKTQIDQSGGTVVISGQSIGEQAGIVNRASVGGGNACSEDDRCCNRLQVEI